MLKFKDFRWKEKMDKNLKERNLTYDFFIGKIKNFTKEYAWWLKNYAGAYITKDRFDEMMKILKKEKK